MIRKKFLVAFLILCVLCNCACGQERPKQGWQYDAEVIPAAPETGYQIEECTLEDMEQPAGICRFQDKIVVSDKEKHCLFVLNPDGELLECIGALGGGQVEFMQPTGLTVHDDRLYVLDAGNDRIQILDGDFEFVESIALGALVHKQGDHFYIDIAVDGDGIIYVSTDSTGRLDSFLYFVEDGEVSHLETPFVGYLAECDGEVYAADTMELFDYGRTDYGKGRCDCGVGCGGGCDIYDKRRCVDDVTKAPHCGFWGGDRMYCTTKRKIADCVKELVRKEE